VFDGAGIEAQYFAVVSRMPGQPRTAVKIIRLSRRSGVPKDIAQKIANVAGLHTPLTDDLKAHCFARAGIEFPEPTELSRNH
jgi:hypothetical protein